MKKRLFSLMLVMLLLIGIMFPSTYAEGTDSTRFSDMPSDWSTTALENAVKNGLITGIDGKIFPKDNLTRAQMAAIVNRAFGATEKATLGSYTDVAGSTWYYDDMAKAVQMKTFVGNGNKLNPNSKITREEAFVVLARAFKLTGNDLSILDKFSDKDLVSTWAKNEVAALVSAGYVAGSNGKINPKKNITRAEFAELMGNIIKNYITTAGTYTSNLNGNVMVNVPDVTLKGLTISGNLIIGDGVGNGDVTLDSVVVTGRTVIRGGGVNSIKIIGNSNLKNIVIARVNGELRVYAEDGTQIGEMLVDGNDDVIIEGNLGSVTVSAADVTVIARNADIQKTTIEGDRSILIVGEKSTIKTASIDGVGAKVITEKDSKVDRIIANGEGGDISGTGTIGTVEANGNGVAVTTIGTKVVAKEGATGILAGTLPVFPGKTEIVGGNPAASSGSGSSGGGGGGSNGGSPSVALSSITISGIVRVGVTLSASVSPAGATVNYQWKLCDTADGTYNNISGATSNQYTPLTEDETKFIKVVASGTGNYTGTVTSAATAVVLPAADFAGGDGSSGNPYQVATAAQLNKVRNHLDKYFIQTADIDLNAAPWNSGEGWEPIGDSTSNFTGSYDGQFFEIQNLNINRQTTNYVGLFGYSAGTLKNIVLENATVAGKDFAGGIVGNNSANVLRSFASGTIGGINFVGGIAGASPGSGSNISECYSTANVSASSLDAGSLAGMMYGTITNCYASGTANSPRAGGLVGAAWGTVTNSYAVGAVSGAGAGGLVGDGSYDVTTGFYDISTTGQSGANLKKGVQKTTVEMKQQATYVDWDFDNIWGLNAAENNGYPFLRWQGYTHIPVSDFAGGDGSSGNPYQVATAAQLNKVRNHLDKYFIQTADIDLNAAPWNSGEGWEPIGDSINIFSGTYDGGGHNIANLYINKVSSYRGLFGYSSGILKNVNLVSGTISNAQANAGLLAGYSDGTIENCTVSGSVSGSAQVGGLVGDNQGTVSNVSSSVDVAGYELVGGLIGKNTGNISVAHATGTVTATGDRIGGLVGSHSTAVISDSYSTGSVSGNVQIGGLVGLTLGGTIEECYAKGNVSGASTIGGLVGYSDPGGGVGVIRNCYATGDANASTWMAGGLVGLLASNCSIINSYAVGIASSPPDCGGLVANSYIPVTITNAYYLNEPNNGIGIKKSEVDMKNGATFSDSGWDFDTVWDIDPTKNNGYPFLMWQGL